MYEIVGLVARAGAVLATGHIAPAEVAAVAGVVQEVAGRAGMAPLLLTHPESRVSGIPLELQQEVARAGARLERCLVSTRPGGGASLDAVAAHIRATGVEANVISTDFGQAHNPPPVEGMAEWLNALKARGFSEAELRQLAGAGPAHLLGLE